MFRLLQRCIEADQPQSIYSLTCSLSLDKSGKDQRQRSLKISAKGRWVVFIFKSDTVVDSLAVINQLIVVDIYY